MEEEASWEEGTDFSEGRNDKQKTTKTSFHFECPDVTLMQRRKSGAKPKYI